MYHENIIFTISGYHILLLQVYGVDVAKTIVISLKTDVDARKAMVFLLQLILGTSCTSVDNPLAEK